MFARRKKLIDKKFQLKVAFSVIGISLIALVAVMAVVVANASKNSRDIRTTTALLGRALDTESGLVSSVLDAGKRADSPDAALRLRGTADDHAKNMDALRAYVATLEGFARQSSHLITLIIALFILQCVVLYVFIIRMTHRISGPIYVISRYMEEIIEGKKPEFRALRDRDEFKKFYERFVAMVDKLERDRE